MAWARARPASGSDTPVSQRFYGGGGLDNRAFVRRPVDVSRVLAADPFPTRAASARSGCSSSSSRNPQDKALAAALSDGAGYEWGAEVISFGDLLDVSAAL